MTVSATDHILLEDTFVLSWHSGPGELSFHVLAHLQPSHPQASAPRSGEWGCYRAGILHFSGVTQVTGLLPQSSVIPTTDAEGSVDYGCIDSLSALSPGSYAISGEFGEVLVAADSMSLVLP